MRIFARSVKEIKDERAQFDSERAQRNRVRQKNEQRRRDDEIAVLAPVRQAVEKLLSQFDRINFDVDVNITTDFAGDYHGSKEVIQVRITSGIDGLSRSDTPLSWDYTVNLTYSGDVKSETSSWSGMNVTTDEDVDYLEQTAASLRVLVDYDWKSLLDKKLPDYKDYMTEGPSEWDDNEKARALDEELKEATISESIGTYKGFAGYSQSQNYRRNTQGYYVFTGQTDKMFKYYFVPEYRIKQWERKETTSEEIRGEIDSYSQKGRKSTILGLIPDIHDVIYFDREHI